MKFQLRTRQGIRACLCLVFAASIALAGCASTGGTDEDEGPSQRSDVISQEELAGLDVSTLYEVVERLRPRWLNTSSRSFSGGTEILVVQNNSVLGDVEILRQMDPVGITELRYMDGDTAAATLVGGRSGFVEGAIVIERS